MEGFLWINAVLVVPGHAGRVVLFYVCDERFKDGVEGINPIDVSPIPNEDINQHVQRRLQYR